MLVPSLRISTCMATIPANRMPRTGIHARPRTRRSISEWSGRPRTRASARPPRATVSRGASRSRGRRTALPSILPPTGPLTRRGGALAWRAGVLAGRAGALTRRAGVLARLPVDARTGRGFVRRGAVTVGLMPRLGPSAPRAGALNGREGYPRPRPGSAPPHGGSAVPPRAGDRRRRPEIRAGRRNPGPAR